MLTKSPAARTALVYVTAGAFILIWTTVWFIYLRSNPTEGNWPYYLIGGLMASGFTLLILGLGLGRLGSSARDADNAPIVVATPPAAVVATPTVANPPAATMQPPPSHPVPTTERVPVVQLPAPSLSRSNPSAPPVPVVRAH